MTVDEMIEKLQELSKEGHGGLPVMYYSSGQGVHGWCVADPKFNPDDEGDFIEL